MIPRTGSKTPCCGAPPYKEEALKGKTWGHCRRRNSTEERELATEAEGESGSSIADCGPGVWVTMTF